MNGISACKRPFSVTNVSSKSNYVEKIEIRKQIKISCKINAMGKVVGLPGAKSEISGPNF